MNLIRRGKKGRKHNGVTSEEWRKRLAMLPEDVFKKALSNYTNLYFNVEVENRQDPLWHFEYRFLGIRYPRWEVYLLKAESHNEVALQDYSRNVGVPPILKTDNAQSEVRRAWRDHFHHQCIKQESTEPDHPWENPAEHKIGQLNSMVKNVMREFNVPLKEHDW
eukprot:15337752-Ditylum_brightwellii.AAC.1